jgi:hypothetical protein
MEAATGASALMTDSNRSQPEAKLKGREDSKHPQGGMREQTGMENNVGITISQAESAPTPGHPGLLG